jgi:uncharacterized membrane protein
MVVAAAAFAIFSMSASLSESAMITLPVCAFFEVYCEVINVRLDIFY